VPKPAEPDADAGRMPGPIDVARLQQSPERRREHQAGIMPALTARSRSASSRVRCSRKCSRTTAGAGIVRADRSSLTLRSLSDVPRTPDLGGGARSNLGDRLFPAAVAERPPPSSATPTRMVDV
jgi:hypothetical protein